MRSWTDEVRTIGKVLGRSAAAEQLVADTRRRIEALGFRTPDGLDAVTGQEFGANLSKERTDLLDVGVLVWLVDGAKDREKLHAETVSF